MPHPHQQRKPTLAIPHSLYTLPSNQEPSFRRLTSTGNVPVKLNAPTYVTRTLPRDQSYADDAKSPCTPYNSKLATPFATQECTHTKHQSLCKLFLETLPRQVYLSVLLGLPTLYSTHMSKIFEAAETNAPNIILTQETLVLERTNEKDEATSMSPLYTNLKHTWEYFIDSLVTEYQTFNLISVLLFSAVLAILQIESAAGDLLTRFSALLSLICALISFLYGCIYIIWFGSMRKTRKVEEWVIEAQKTKASIFWNVWVLLAMPSIWLAWSTLFFVIGILSFVWRTGTTTSDKSPPIVTARDILGPRIVITVIFGLGFTYSIFIFTTFRRYANAMRETHITHIKHVPLPTNQDVQLPYQQALRFHQPALTPHQCQSYLAHKVPDLPLSSTVTIQRSSGVNTPLSVMYADDQHNISLYSPHRTIHLSDSMCPQLG